MQNKMCIKKNVEDTPIILYNNFLISSCIDSKKEFNKK